MALPVRPSTPVRRAGPAPQRWLRQRFGNHAPRRPRSPSPGSRGARATPSAAASWASSCTMLLLAMLVRHGHRRADRGQCGDRASWRPSSRACRTSRSSTSSTFAQPTKVYDRTGNKLLATFQREERTGRHSSTRSRSWSSTPPPWWRTARFWENQGYDLQSTVVRHAARTSRARPTVVAHRPSPSSWCAPRLLPKAAAGAGRGPVRAQGQGAHPVGQADRRRSRARQGKQRSSPPTSTRSSTATTPMASRPRPRRTSARRCPS